MRVLRAGLGLVLLGSVLTTSAGCQPGEERPGGARPRIVMPDAGVDVDGGQRRPKRAKLDLPPPVPPMPKIDGAPMGVSDMNRLREAVLAGKPDERPGAPPIRIIDADRMEIGKVLLDKAARRIEVPMRVNMVKGILEYIAVTTNGKLHESLLEMQAVPSHLHLAMLLLDLETNEYVPQKDAGRRMTREGSRVRLYVERATNTPGVVERVPVESWLLNRKTKKPGKAVDWLFSGSIFWDSSYASDGSRSVIGLVPDDTCVLTTTSDIGNPYHGAGLGYDVNTKAVPAIGTPVKLVIEPVAKKSGP